MAKDLSYIFEILGICVGFFYRFRNVCFLLRSFLPSVNESRHLPQYMC